VAKWCGVLSRAEVFLMGEVLDKHMDVPVRARKVAA